MNISSWTAPGVVRAVDSVIQLKVVDGSNDVFAAVIDVQDGVTAGTFETDTRRRKDGSLSFSSNQFIQFNPATKRSSLHE